MQEHPEESPAEVAERRTLAGRNGPEAAQQAKNQQIQALARELTNGDIERFVKLHPGELVLHMFTWVSPEEREAALKLIFRKDFGTYFRDFLLEHFSFHIAYKAQYEQFKLAIARHKLEMRG